MSGPLAPRCQPVCLPGSLCLSFAPSLSLSKGWHSSPGSPSLEPGGAHLGACHPIHTCLHRQPSQGAEQPDLLGIPVSFLLVQLAGRWTDPWPAGGTHPSLIQECAGMVPSSSFSSLPFFIPMELGSQVGLLNLYLLEPKQALLGARDARGRKHAHPPSGTAMLCAKGAVGPCRPGTLHF